MNEKSVENETGFPLVTIVMATYNGEKYLEEQLNSVVNQSYRSIELIVLDDGSKDNTVNILQKYAARYPFMRVVQNDVNLGYIKNFEKGCTLANGQYISFCDQDDVWDLEKTELLMQEIGAHPMIYCDSALVNGNLEPLHNHSALKNLAPFDNCLYFATDNCVGGHALVMKKEIALAAIPFPIQMPHDLWLAFFTTFYGSISYYNIPLVKWRQHGHNITQIKKNKETKEEEARQRLAIFYNACPESFSRQKHVLSLLYKSYQHTLPCNFKRMLLFIRYQRYFLAMKKRNAFRKWLFCLKMFVKIREHV